MMPSHTVLFGVELLLRAAEYVERREREAEHGYASTRHSYGPFSFNVPRTRKKNGGCRSSHNELEKNRRAHLRSCLDRLKELVPLAPDVTRHTTLGLLISAKLYIISLREKEKKNALTIEKLHRERRRLQRRLHILCAESEAMTRRSENNTTSTDASTDIDAPSTSGMIGSTTDDHSVEVANPEPCEMEIAYTQISESDEIDVIGYTSTVSEDEFMSFRSSSDSGVNVSTTNVPDTQIDTN